MIVVGTISYFLGSRGLALILITIFGSLLAFVLGVWLLFYIRPPNVQLALRNGDTGLRLTGLSHSGEGHGASNNKNGS